MVITIVPPRMAARPVKQEVWEEWSRTEELREKAFSKVRGRPNIMTTNPVEELIIAAHMRALSIVFEGEAANSSRIFTQACVGFDPEVIGDRCCLIAASDADAIVAVFDPEQIEAGPVAIGICILAYETVRLEFGNLWVGADGRAALIASDGYFTVENGRVVRRMGKPVRDLARGMARARRRLADVVSVSSGEGILVVSMG